MKTEPIRFPWSPGKWTIGSVSTIFGAAALAVIFRDQALDYLQEILPNKFAMPYPDLPTQPETYSVQSDEGALVITMSAESNSTSMSHEHSSIVEEAKEKRIKRIKENIHMYRHPDGRLPTDREIEQYASRNALIDEFALKEFDTFGIGLRDGLVYLPETLTDEDHAHFIERFSSTGLETQKYIIASLPFMSDENKVELTRRIIEKGNASNFGDLTAHLYTLPESGLRSVVESFTNPNEKWRFDPVVSLVKHLGKFDLNDQLKIVEVNLRLGNISLLAESYDSLHSEIQNQVSSHFIENERWDYLTYIYGSLPEDIQLGVKDDILHVSSNTADSFAIFEMPHMIPHVSISDQNIIVERILERATITGGERTFAFQYYDHLTDENKEKLFRSLMDNNSEFDYRIIARNYAKLSVEQQIEFLEHDIIRSGNERILIALYNSIPDLTDAAESVLVDWTLESGTYACLSELLSHIAHLSNESLDSVLDISQPDDRIGHILMYIRVNHERIPTTIQDEILSRLRIGSTDPDIAAHIRIIEDRFRDTASSFDRLATKTPFDVKYLFESRTDFPKTGSSITLLKDVDGVIIRSEFHLTNYLSWRLAYENTELWKELGFDYVPIEDIVRPQPPVTGWEISAATRVVQGPDVFTWTHNAGTHIKEITSDVDAIKHGLEHMNIDHGHDHKRNFVLCFTDVEKGEYMCKMIDFDEANRVFRPLRD